MTGERMKRTASGLIVVTAFLLVTGVISGHLAGWRTMVVTTGSMSPTYPAGALIVVEPPSSELREVGDVIVFPHPDAAEIRVTHRVTGVTPEGYATQGDANEDEDPWTVPTSSIEGRVRAGAPGIGLALTRFRTGPGPWLLAAAILLGELVRQVRSWRAERDVEVSDAGAAAVLLPVLVVALASGIPGSTSAVFRDSASVGVLAATGEWGCADDAPGKCGDGSQHDDPCPKGRKPASCNGEVDESTSAGGASEEDTATGRSTASDVTTAEPTDAASGGEAAVEPSGTPSGEEPGEPTEADPEPHPASQPQAQPAPEDTHADEPEPEAQPEPADPGADEHGATAPRDAASAEPKDAPGETPEPDHH